MREDRERPVGEVDASCQLGVNPSTQAVPVTDIPRFNSKFVSASATIAVGILAFLFALELIYNYDIWWHLKTGQFIVETGAVPMSDVLSFSTASAEWIPHYWLADVIFYLLHLALGVNGLVIFKALVVALTFMFAHRMATDLGAEPVLAALIIGLVVPVARFRFLLRPAVFMLLLTVLLIWLVSKWDGRSWKPLIAIMAVLLAWTNLHASFPLGLVIIGCLAADRGFAWATRRGLAAATEKRAFKLSIAVLLGSALLSLINPFGLQLHRWVIGDFVAKSVTTSFEIQEHLPLRWEEHTGFWVLLGCTVLSFLLAGRSGRILHLLVLAGLTFLALRSVRYVAVAAVPMAAIVALNLEHAVSRIGWQATLRRRLFTIPVAIVGAVCAVMAFQLTFTDDKVYRFGVGVKESRYPAGAARYLRSIGVSGNLFNSWKHGGYLVWHLPGVKTFIDGRCLDQQLELVESTRVMGQVEFEQMLARMGVTTAVVAHTDRVTVGRFDNSSDFRVVFFDDQALVFQHRDALCGGDPCAVAAFRFLRPQDYDFRYLVRNAGSDLAAFTEEELRRAVSLAPESFRPHFFLGLFLGAQGRVEGIDHYLAAIQANRSLAFTHYPLANLSANLAIQTGRPQVAVEVLSDARSFGLDEEGLFLLGTSLYMTGRLAEAEGPLRESIEANPDAPQASVNLGFVLLDLDRSLEALVVFDNLVQSQPNQADAAFGRALALQESGQKSQAENAWTDFISENPEGEWSMKARRHLQALQTARALGR